MMHMIIKDFGTFEITSLTVMSLHTPFVCNAQVSSDQG